MVLSYDTEKNCHRLVYDVGNMKESYEMYIFG